jgi:BirA family biotin operon repressor/biotin-[acetyl-CoA-carboxylase] ligase
MDQIHYAVVGIGINVNIREFPEGLRSHVTSLALELGYPVQRAPLVQDLLRSLEKWYFILIEENFEQILDLSRRSSLLFETWRSLSCTLGKQVEIKTGKGVIRGLATRVEPDGSLYVREDSGKERQIVTGDLVEVSKVS